MWGLKENRPFLLEIPYVSQANIFVSEEKQLSQWPFWTMREVLPISLQNVHVTGQTVIFVKYSSLSAIKICITLSQRGFLLDHRL
ncbi:hypothetical protein Y1Q_0002266 [Alligator mississippiensis]|uniref:Uncharacterized protein n=1 Tax=Alligator mississippiensis TaxID=8496 RepID=A0A151MGJ1_ALLMI|nr:hypothetical protein Y1Q_0002266 [Alligator mississippiensis]